MKYMSFDRISENVRNKLYVEKEKDVEDVNAQWTTYTPVIFFSIIKNN